MYLRYTVVTVGVALVAILGLLLTNTFAAGPTLPETPPGALIEIDEEGAAARLSEAVTYRTVSERRADQQLYRCTEKTPAKRQAENA